MDAEGHEVAGAPEAAIVANDPQVANTASDGGHKMPNVVSAPEVANVASAPQVANVASAPQIADVASAPQVANVASAGGHKVADVASAGGHKAAESHKVAAEPQLVDVASIEGHKATTDQQVVSATSVRSLENVDTSARSHSAGCSAFAGSSQVQGAGGTRLRTERAENLRVAMLRTNPVETSILPAWPHALVAEQGRLRYILHIESDRLLSFLAEDEPQNGGEDVLRSTMRMRELSGGMRLAAAWAWFRYQPERFQMYEEARPEGAEEAAPKALPVQRLP